MVFLIQYMIQISTLEFKFDQPKIKSFANTKLTKNYSTPIKWQLKHSGLRPDMSSHVYF